jgi:predicted O-methyltransferase YrrM
MLNIMRAEVHQKNGLSDLINYCNLKSAIMLEVGSYAGESTNIFWQSQKFREIHCLDPWLAGYDSTDYASNHMGGIEEEFLKFASDKKEIFIHKNFSDEIDRIFSDEFFDFIYIDACHTYEAVCADITKCLPKIKKTGFIAGHDYNDSTFNVTQAVLDKLGVPHKIFSDSSWVFNIQNLKLK